MSRFEPNPTNASENKQTQFECYGSGLPLPTFFIKQVKPAAGMFCYYKLKRLCDGNFAGVLSKLC